MANLFQAVVSFFDENDWPMSQTELKNVIKVPFKGSNGQWDCYARVKEEDGKFAFYSQLPLQVPESKKIPMALLLSKINFGLLVGNFEFDFEEGAVRYKTSISVGDQALTFSLIEQIVYINGVTSDRYLPQIQAVLESD